MTLQEVTKYIFKTTEFGSAKWTAVHHQQDVPDTDIIVSASWSDQHTLGPQANQAIDAPAKRVNVSYCQINLLKYHIGKTNLLHSLCTVLFWRAQLFWIHMHIYDDRFTIARYFNNSKKTLINRFVVIMTYFERDILLIVTSTACAFPFKRWQLPFSKVAIYLKQSSEQLGGLCQLKASQPPQAMSSSIYPPARDKWHHCGEERVKTVWYGGFVIFRPSFCSWC